MVIAHQDNLILKNSIRIIKLTISFKKYGSKIKKKVNICTDHLFAMLTLLQDVKVSPKAKKHWSEENAKPSTLKKKQ